MSKDKPSMALVGPEPRVCMFSIHILVSRDFRMPIETVTASNVLEWSCTKNGCEVFPEGLTPEQAQYIIDHPREVFK